MVLNGLRDHFPDGFIRFGRPFSLMVLNGLGDHFSDGFKQDNVPGDLNCL